MYNPFSLKGKTVLITGASSGIGRAAALECAKMGANIIITGRNVERLNETFMQLEGQSHRQIVADLEDQASVDKLADSIENLDGLVHCAGVLISAPFPFLKYENVTSAMNANFFAPYYLSHALIKKKKIGVNSSIIFLASIGGIRTVFFGGAAYAASKGALFALAKNMALDLKTKKIRVNTILPGMIETPLIQMDEITQEQYEEDAKQYIYKRYGKPEEVAYMIVYLLSDASAWVTGGDFVIDGGITLL